MKKILLIAAVTLVTSMPVLAQDSQELAKRIDIAKKYSEIVPVENEINAAIEQLSLQVPVDRRALMTSILKRSIKADRLKAVSELALAETFTTAELQALVDFYGTPEGVSVREKMPDYQNKIAPVLEGMIREAVSSYQKQVQ